MDILEIFCEKWQAEEYNSYKHEFLKELGLSAQISGESISVKENPKFYMNRLFELGDGRRKLFEYHIKLPEGFRLYFYPDKRTKMIFVAYLGPHLQTKRH